MEESDNDRILAFPEKSIKNMLSTSTLSYSNANADNSSYLDQQCMDFNEAYSDPTNSLLVISVRFT